MENEIVWAPEISFVMKQKMLQIGIARRTQLEQVQKMFDAYAQREEIETSLQNAAITLGKPLDEQTLEYAVGQVLDKSYRFQEPENNFAYKLAQMYVDRERVIKKRIIPGAMILGLSTAIGLTVSVADSIRSAKLERAVEEKVESAYSRRIMQVNELKSLENIKLTSSALVTSTSESLNLAKTQLDDSDKFFLTYAPKGSATVGVTVKNYREAEKLLPAIENSLDSSNSNIQTLKRAVETQKKLDSGNVKLESLIKTIKAQTSQNSIFFQNAQTAYSQGKTSYDTADLKLQQEQIAFLSQIQTQVLEFKVLPAKLEQLCSSVQAISKDPKADALSNELCTNGKTYVTNANLAALKENVDKLDKINTTLKLNYTLKVVNKKGEKTGIDRYYTDKDGKRASGYYVIVQAINESGNSIPVTITSIENQEQIAVNKWGEKIPKEVYDSIAKDKKDNGILDTYSIFGQKEIGHLEPKVTMKGVDLRSGQIVRW